MRAPPSTHRTSQHQFWKEMETQFWQCVGVMLRKTFLLSFLLSERLASLSIRGAQVRAPLKPPVHHSPRISIWKSQKWKCSCGSAAQGEGRGRLACEPGGSKHCNAPGKRGLRGLRGASIGPPDAGRRQSLGQLCCCLMGLGRVSLSSIGEEGFRIAVRLIGVGFPVWEQGV